jgi:hypothetical protein
MEESIKQFESGLYDALVGVVGGILFVVLLVVLNALHAGLIFYAIVFIYFIADLLAGLFKAIITGIIYSMGLLFGGLIVGDGVTVVLAIIGLVVNLASFF